MGSPPFPNDGSFLERFKQMHGASSVNEPGTTSSASSQPVNITIKKNCSITTGVKPATTSPAAAAAGAPSLNGKLAFSLKPKARPAINPLKLADIDDDEEEDTKGESERQAKKQKLDIPEKLLGSLQSASNPSSPPPPADPDVKKVADKLASFVAKTGRQFEDITRQKNPTDPRFGFLFDVNCPEYKYYEHRLAEEQSVLGNSQEEQNLQPIPSSREQTHRSAQLASYQTPASALYDYGEDENYNQEPSKHSSDTASTDSLAMMEFYMKKAAQEDLRKPLKHAKNEMPPPPSLSTPKRGHHMGDYIPQEELEKFMAKCNDAHAQKFLVEAQEKAKIQADNVGHRLLSKMGWKEGEGLGSGRSGRADPVQAGSVKLNNLGVGAEQPGEVTAEDDIYEQYKKRMMLGYRFRPNPLNNPRKAYY